MMTESLETGMEWPQGTNGEYHAMQWFCGLATRSSEQPVAAEFYLCSLGASAPGM